MVRAWPQPHPPQPSPELGQATVELVALLPLIAVLGALLVAGGRGRPGRSGSPDRRRARRRARVRSAPTRARPRGACSRRGSSAGSPCGASAAREGVRVAIAIPAVVGGCAPRDRLRARAATGPDAMIASRAERRGRAGLGGARDARAARRAWSCWPRRSCWRRAPRASSPTTPPRPRRSPLLQGGDPRAAARDAVPGWSRERMAVRVDGRRVHVRLPPAIADPGRGRAARGAPRGRRRAGGAVSVAPRACSSTSWRRRHARDRRRTRTSSPPTKHRTGRARNPRRARPPVSPSWRRPTTRSRSAPRLASRLRAAAERPPSWSCVWTAGIGRAAVRGGRRRCPRRAGSPRRSARAGTTRGRPAGSCSCGSPRRHADAAVQARRAAAAAGDAPTVLALGGPRVAAFDELLAEQDLVVVATPSGTDPALRATRAGGPGIGRCARVRLRGPSRTPGARCRCGRSRAAAVGAPSARRRRRGAAVSGRRSPRMRRGGGPRRGRPGHDPAARARDRRARWARWSSARSRAAWGCRATSSGPPTSRRSPARARCTTRTRGCSSRPCSGAAPNPAHLERAEYVARGRDAAIATARRNGAHDVEVSFPDADDVRAGARSASTSATRSRYPARTSRSRPARGPRPSSRRRRTSTFATGVGEYRGPLAMRQGKPMRPDVAAAFDRMAAAARARRRSR